MISWMQKHNKYLVWTIWIATIAFIGAGFVGWGSYQFGANPDKIAKVGDIEIDRATYEFTYRNIYNNYNQQLQGQLDEQKAKELKISEQAMSMVENKAKLLNLAKHYGIQVSEVEIAQALQATESFQTNGKFDRKLYDQQLSNIKLKSKTYEAMLKDEIIITKLISLLKTTPTEYENKIIASSFLAENTIKYRVLTSQDVKIDTSDKSLNEYWIKNKNKFKHPTKYQVEILWTPLAKTKKEANRAYIAFKNGKSKSDKNIIISENNQTIPAEILDELKSSKSGDILKPKVFEDKYATIKLIKTIEPKLKSFNEAKNDIIMAYKEERGEKELNTLAQHSLANLKNSTNADTKIVSLRNITNLNGLNNDESLQFLQKLFTSNKENSIIIVNNKIVVYNILSKKILEHNQEENKMVYDNTLGLKKSIFEANLLKSLDKKYITKNY